jgi:mevalonate kinase
MRRERTTLVGTPTVVAPGAIFLVGEFGLPEEEVAVLAALSSYATAQYFPDVSPHSPLVAAVVERAKTHLGEAAAALPAGSVLLSPAKAPGDGQGLTFDTAPAIAVATAAAVFETAGQSIGERRDEILVVAEAGLRAVHGGIAADGELAAALNGGLIKVVTLAAAAPRVEALAPLAGLHLVVFQTGHALFADGWLSSVRQFAERNRVVYAQIANELLDQASRFSAGLSAGNATAAIAAAGRYGYCITQLAAAASAPLQSGSFMRAIDLAKEIGGVAKTTSAWRTGMGVAMFATPEAANLFAHACQPALASLAVELDRSGVRCLEPAAVHTPAPETGPSSISAQAIVRDPVEERTTEKTLPEAEPDLSPRPRPAGTQARVPAPEAEAEEVDPQDAGQPSRKRSRLGPAIGGVLIIVAVLAVWLTKSLGHHSTRPAKTQDYAAALKVPSLPPPEIPAPIAPAEVVPSPNEPPLPVVVPSSRVGSPPALPPPSSAKAHASARRSHAPKSGKMQKPAAAPPIQAISSPKPAAPHERPKPSAPRAGKLSNDDF